jgi:uncharacterized protein DUF5906
MKCGVPAELFGPYDFMDMKFNQSGANPLYNPIYGALADVCLSLARGGYLVRDVTTKRWVEIDKLSKAKAKMTNEYAGVLRDRHGNVITMALTGKDISDYLRDACPVFSGFVAIPLADEFVIYRGEKRINSFKMDFAPSTPAYAPACEPVLRIIREALCGEPERLTYGEMLDILTKNNDPREDKFRFVMNWLAAIHQEPGINLQTNLWFLGQTTGIGKGTLFRVLSLVFGSSVGKASSGDIERGWNDFALGKLIMEADEFSGDGKRKNELNGIIKRDTTNQLLTINKRGTTPFEVPNITNWGFTSNEVFPLHVDDDDRRNCLFNTTNDIGFKKLTLEFNHKLDGDTQFRREIAEGFAALLDGIPVDKKLIATALDTDIKRDNRESSKNAVETWLMRDPLYTRDREQESVKLFLTFKDWTKDYFPMTKINNINAFSRELGRLAKHGKIHRREVKGAAHRFTIPSENFPKSGT